jgi:hypothetical protein
LGKRRRKAPGSATGKRLLVWVQAPVNKWVQGRCHEFHSIQDRERQYLQETGNAIYNGPPLRGGMYRFTYKHGDQEYEDYYSEDDETIKEL